jgi:hypothetical protein
MGPVSNYDHGESPETNNYLVQSGDGGHSWSIHLGDAAEEDRCPELATIQTIPQRLGLLFRLLVFLSSESADGLLLHHLHCDGHVVGLLPEQWYQQIEV